MVKQLKDAEAVVEQIPVRVRIECPYCSYENEVDYKDFCCNYGEPPDWDYKIFECQKCSREIEIQGQDW